MFGRKNSQSNMAPTFEVLGLRTACVRGEGTTAMRKLQWTLALDRKGERGAAMAEFGTSARV